MCRTIRPRSLALWMLMAWLVSPISQAAAAEAEQRYQSALDAMLADIGDPQKSFDFVQAATEVGDLRGAVAALERMLLINPGLANIQLELGVLYLRLGNASLGQYHINRALQAPNVPRVVRERAEALLAASGGQRGRNFLRGLVGLAYHYDENANAAPSSPEVLIGGGPLGNQIGLLSAESLGQSDSFVDLTAGATHVYAFAGDSGHSYETGLLLYANKYDKFSNLDFFIASLDTGPAFRIAGSGDAPIVLRPYISGAHDLLDGERYLTSFGGGVELRAQASVRTYGFLRIDYSDQDFQDSLERVVSDRSGGYFSGNAGLVHQFNQSFQISVDVAAEQADADANYEAYTRYGGGLGAKFFFGYGGKLPPWSIGLSARARKTDYDAADPQISSIVVRDDTRYDGMLAVDVPISRSLLLSLKGQYADNDSSIPNYTFDNTGGSLGISWRF